MDAEQGRPTVIFVLKIPLDCKGQNALEKDQSSNCGPTFVNGVVTPLSEKAFGEQKLSFVHLCIHRAGHTVVLSKC